MNRLENKTAVITGGAGGIGIRVAKLFAEEGANVLIVDVDEKQLQSACSEIGSNRVTYFVADVTSESDNQTMIETAVQRYGGLDCLAVSYTHLTLPTICSV